MYKDQMQIVRGNKFKLDIEIVDKQTNGLKNVTTREVVRGVIIKDKKVLLVYPQDEILYGIPGGGIEIGESKEEALRREMKEEIGAQEVEIVEYIGKMAATRLNFGKEGVLQLVHHYYLINIKNQGEQELISYEQELNLTFGYFYLDDAIAQNENMLAKRKQTFLDFYTNQTEIFKELKRIYTI